MNTIYFLSSEIKKRRKLLNLTQSDLAEISEVSIRSLKAIETTEGNPSLSKLEKVLDSLGLKIEIGVKTK